jgi:hypothetical protein
LIVVLAPFGARVPRPLTPVPPHECRPWLQRGRGGGGTETCSKAGGKGDWEEEQQQEGFVGYQGDLNERMKPAASITSLCSSRSPTVPTCTFQEAEEEEEEKHYLLSPKEEFESERQ